MTSVDLGNYNEARRMQEVKERLEKCFVQFRKSLQHPENQSNDQKSKQKNEANTRQSVQLTFLQEEKVKIRITEEKIEKFHTGHFTQEYRVLREECVQHQFRLDEFDHCDNEKIRKIRKESLCRIETMLNTLNSKTHESGEPCKDCEIQNI